MGLGKQQWIQKKKQASAIANPISNAVADHVMEQSKSIQFALSHVNWDVVALYYAVLMFGMEVLTCAFLFTPQGFSADNIFYLAASPSSIRVWKA